MTQVYLGYPPENIKAWIEAHSSTEPESTGYFLWNDGSSEIRFNDYRVENGVEYWYPESEAPIRFIAYVHDAEAAGVEAYSRPFEELNGWYYDSLSEGYFCGTGRDNTDSSNLGGLPVTWVEA